MVNFIDTVIAQSGRILRGNRFKVTLNLPTLIGGQLAGQKSTVFALSTSMPSTSLGVVEIPAYGGNIAKVPGDVTIPEWSCTFIVDPDMMIYRALQRWKESMNSHLTGLRANDLVFYGNADVQLLDGVNATVQSWSMEKIFPTEIGEIALSKEDRDSFLQFDTTFSVNSIITNLV